MIFVRRSNAIFTLAALIIASLVLTTGAEARVFDFKNERFAMYFGGSFGTSNASAGAFALAAPSDVVYDKQVSTSATGEFGMLFSGTRFNLRLGAEYLMPRDQVGVNATDANKTQLFSLTSKVSALVPIATLEFMPYRGALSRAVIGGGFGWALVSLSNEYTMTSAGQTRFGVGNYKETGTGSASLFEGYAGWEFLFTDTTTATINAGYRYCQVRTLTSSQNTNAIAGQQKENQEILNADDSHRSMDRGGAFIGINFRFYL